MMMPNEKTSIWLDDVRYPPKDESLPLLWFKTAEELQKHIQDFGLSSIDEISFDNDLGFTGMTGRQLVDWIENYVVENKVTEIPLLWAHSANPIECENMEKIFIRIRQYAEDNKNTNQREQ